MLDFPELYSLQLNHPETARVLRRIFRLFHQRSLLTIPCINYLYKSVDPARWWIIDLRLSEVVLEGLSPSKPAKGGKYRTIPGNDYNSRSVCTAISFIDKYSCEGRRASVSGEGGSSIDLEISSFNVTGRPKASKGDLRSCEFIAGAVT